MNKKKDTGTKAVKVEGRQGESNTDLNQFDMFFKKSVNDMASSRAISINEKSRIDQ